MLTTTIHARVRIFLSARFSVSFQKHSTRRAFLVRARYIIYTRAREKSHFLRGGKKRVERLGVIRPSKKIRGVIASVHRSVGNCAAIFQRLCPAHLSGLPLARTSAREFIPLHIGAVSIIARVDPPRAQFICGRKKKWITLYVWFEYVTMK